MSWHAPVLLLLGALAIGASFWYATRDVRKLENMVTVRDRTLERERAEARAIAAYAKYVIEGRTD